MALDRKQTNGALNDILFACVCLLLSSVQSVDLKAFKMANFNESCDSQVDTATNHDQANTHDGLCFSEQF